MNQSQSRGQHDDVNKLPLDLSQSRLREYVVTLSSGEEIYILAANAMDAAYDALELSMDRKANLINVRITDEW